MMLSIGLLLLPDAHDALFQLFVAEKPMLMMLSTGFLLLQSLPSYRYWFVVARKSLFCC